MAAWTAGLMFLAAAGIPLSLLWDFSWESTVGVDRFWAPAHTANYLAVALAGLVALRIAVHSTRTAATRAGTLRLGGLHAPLGAWVCLWGALAFPTAVVFDRWWQSAYGLGAGIWHPPQILKAVSFFAILTGAWLLAWKGQNEAPPGAAARAAVAVAGIGGLILAMITVVMLPSLYPNRQHSASFYKILCATCPLVLVALAAAGRRRWPATVAALVYTALVCVMVWLLPLFPAKPQTGPIYNALDHLMPPPFPLLLVVPALALDGLLRWWNWPAHRGRAWLQAGVAGLVFFVAFLLAQWLFAEFLLTPDADNRFFAGGGRHWPFFLKIDEASRSIFWETRADELNFSSSVAAVGLAMLSARVGLWLGHWMSRVRR